MSDIHWCHHRACNNIWSFEQEKKYGTSAVSLWGLSILVFFLVLFLWRKVVPSRPWDSSEPYHWLLEHVERSGIRYTESLKGWVHLIYISVLHSGLPSPSTSHRIAIVDPHIWFVACVVTCWYWTDIWWAVFCGLPSRNCCEMWSINQSWTGKMQRKSWH